jgi:aminoglycoside phosphotransferase (APT) family kinase protein
MGALATARGDATAGVLTAALQAVHGAGARLEHWSVDPAFTPHGRGRVTRYELAARVASAPEVVRHDWLGKWYDTAADGARVAAVLAELGASDCRARGGPEVSRVVAYDRSRRLLVLTYEVGEPVSAAIAHDRETVLGTVGRALAALHATPVTRSDIRAATDLLEDLRPRIAELCARFPGAAAALGDAALWLEHALPPLPASPCFLHGDFGPTNLLWRNGHIVALDFDKCAHGDPALDLGNLLAQLRRMSVRTPAELGDFAGARARVLDAYRCGGALDRDLERRLAWYERAILLRKIHRLACNSARHPDTEQNPRRQAEARRLLNDALCCGDTTAAA